MREAAPTDVDGPIAWREVAPDDPAGTIVFLHGLGGSRTAWDPQLLDLGDTWRCVAWDLPGYGASPPLDGSFTFAALADAVADLLDALEVERAHLVGLSFGGMIAQHAALAHPDRVDRLVLVDTSAAFGLDGTDPDEWRRLRTDPLDAGNTPADIARGVLATVGGPLLAGAALDAQVAAMARIPTDGLRAAVQCLPTHDVRHRLAEITAPTLVIVGELDAETPVVYARTLADGIPLASLEVIPGAGHLTPAETPAEVNSLLRTWFQLGTVPS